MKFSELANKQEQTAIRAMTEGQIEQGIQDARETLLGPTGDYVAQNKARITFENLLAEKVLRNSDMVEQTKPDLSANERSLRLMSDNEVDGLVNELREDLKDVRSGAPLNDYEKQKKLNMLKDAQLEFAKRTVKQRTDDEESRRQDILTDEAKKEDRQKAATDAAKKEQVSNKPVNESKAPTFLDGSPIFG
jgi:hypothetical protein